MSKSKDKDLLLEGFTRILFSNRVFYVPLLSSNIYIEEDKLSIDLADLQSYSIVDGIRCYYVLIYDAAKDEVTTWLEPSGMQYKIFSLKDSETVAPKRYYSEITEAYFRQHPDLDQRIVSFLSKHPEKFEEADSIKAWKQVSDLLKNPNIRYSMTFEDYLKSAAELFYEEEIKK